MRADRTSSVVIALSLRRAANGFNRAWLCDFAATAPITSGPQPVSYSHRAASIA